MKKMIIMSLAVSSILFADVSTSTMNQQQKSESEREQQQRSVNQSATDTETKSRGDEQSINKSITRSLNNIRSLQQSEVRNENNSLNLVINPIPFLFDNLRELGWTEKAFYLDHNDIKAVDYIEARDDEYGSIQNLGKLQALENSAKTKESVNKDVTRSVESAINLLLNTANLMDRSIKVLQRNQNLNIANFEVATKEALTRSYKQLRQSNVKVNKCSFGGDINTYTCDSGRYVLVLTHSVPQLFVNGSLYYSAQEIRHTKPSLSVSVGSSISDTMSVLAQDSESAAVAEAVREYTSKLRSQGQTQTASQIETAFVEKALTQNINKDITVVKQAIDSASPTAVLRVFQ